MKIHLYERPRPFPFVSEATNIAPRYKVLDVSYDATALERFAGVVYALKLEDIPLEAVAMGVRSYWSVRAYQEARGYGPEFNQAPDQMNFEPRAYGSSHGPLKLMNVPVLLDPYAHEDSIRPLCGQAGTRLAL